MQVFAEAIEKSGARIEFKRIIFSVDFQVNVYGTFRADRCSFFGCICRRTANELRPQSHCRTRDGELLEELAAGFRAAE